LTLLSTSNDTILFVKIGACFRNVNRILLK
jgi:hypothetical protein